MLDGDICYSALLASDRRFDGLFFVGISTTGIYCRPICPAKKARRKSCTFYVSAAAAENAGYRPCLRCRPERAPTVAPYEARSAIVSGIVARIQEGCLNGDADVDCLSADFDLSARQLRRIVREVTGASPIQLAQTSRLLLAKQLLTETKLPITQVAFASGYSSVRRFNESFALHYRMPPSRLRMRAGEAQTNGSLALHLSFRPPLAWDALLKFIEHRAIAGVDCVEEGCYRRTVSISEHVGWVEVTMHENGDALIVRVSSTLSPVLQQLLARLRDLFDLHARPDVIDQHLGNDALFSKLVDKRPGLRVPGAFNGFELAWRAVLGQQVSVRAASTIANRFVQHFGETVDTPHSELTHLTPTPFAIAAARAEDIAEIGIPLARASSIRSIARLCQAEPTLLCPGSPVQRAFAQLLCLPGIGPWTVAYITMRALHWPDAFPETDLGIRHALGLKRGAEIIKASQPWRPWRAYAAMHLWTQLSEDQS